MTDSMICSMGRLVEKAHQIFVVLLQMNINGSVAQKRMQFFKKLRLGLKTETARIHYWKQNVQHSACCTQQLSKDAVAVGNDRPGYSKLLLLLLQQKDIRNGYCGILVDAPPVWLEPLLRSFALQKSLSLSR